MSDRSKVFRGDRLKKIRETRGLTQDDLNTRLGLGNTQIHRYETGKAEPSPDVLVRIARAVDVTTDYLLGLVDNPNERLSEKDLSSTEVKLLSALRQGDYPAAMRILADEADKPVKNFAGRPVLDVSG